MRVSESLRGRVADLWGRYVQEPFVLPIKYRPSNSATVELSSTRGGDLEGKGMNIHITNAA